MNILNANRTASIGLIALATLLSACDGKDKDYAAKSDIKATDHRTAVAQINPTAGSTVSGTVTFIEDGDDYRVVVDLKGLTPGEHGFHVHENGDCSAPDGKSAGGHFNPSGMPHAAPTAEKRHVGDLGNLTANDSGVAYKETKDSAISFDGKNSILGKAVIVHAGRDDLSSQPSGDAGARVACGVIELQK